MPASAPAADQKCASSRLPKHPHAAFKEPQLFSLWSRLLSCASFSSPSSPPLSTSCAGSCPAASPRSQRRFIQGALGLHRGRALTQITELTAPLARRREDAGVSTGRTAPEKQRGQKRRRGAEKRRGGDILLKWK